MKWYNKMMICFGVIVVGWVLMNLCGISGLSLLQMVGLAIFATMVRLCEVVWEKPEDEDESEFSDDPTPIREQLSGIFSDAAQKGGWEMSLATWDYVWQYSDYNPENFVRDKHNMLKPKKKAQHTMYGFPIIIKECPDWTVNGTPIDELIERAKEAQPNRRRNAFYNRAADCLRSNNPEFAIEMIKEGMKERNK